MYFKNKTIFFSPSDLITFLESPFASYMDRLLLEDKNQSAFLDPKDAMLKNLQNKGYEHEDAFLSSLISEGKNVVQIKNAHNDVMLVQTKEAMIKGFDVIAQANMQLDNFGGIADFLIKIPGRSNLGD